MASDALHLSFSVKGGAQDPMQLRLSLQQQAAGIVLELDGQRYRLVTALAARLVLPSQLAPLLPAAAEQRGTFIALAAASKLPFLTLVFPHVCFNVYPLGWKAAAAHLSMVGGSLSGEHHGSLLHPPPPHLLCLQEHDAAQLARLAQVLADSRRQQQRSAAAPASGPGTDWVGQHQVMLEQLCDMGTVAEQLLFSSGPTQADRAADAMSLPQAWEALASGAAALQAQRAAAAAALPVVEQAVRQQQRCLEEAAAAIGPCFSEQACAEAGRRAPAALKAQAQLEACRALA